MQAICILFCPYSLNPMSTHHKSKTLSALAPQATDWGFIFFFNEEFLSKSFQHFVIQILKCKMADLDSLSSFLIWYTDRIRDDSCYWKTWGSLLWRLVTFFFPLLRLSGLRHVQTGWIHRFLLPLPPFRSLTSITTKWDCMALNFIK